MSERRASQLVDTNILVYAHDQSAGAKHDQARDLVRDLWKSGEGCLSIQVLQEFFVTVTRKVAKPLSSEIAAQVIADLSVWPVHCPEVDDVLAAIRLQDRYRISFWDAMIVASAVALGCETIWSEDLNAGQLYEGVAVQTPF
jgi:predicted nucleic acid-binding protein